VDWTRSVKQWNKPDTIHEPSDVPSGK